MHECDIFYFSGLSFFFLFFFIPLKTGEKNQVTQCIKKRLGGAVAKVIPPTTNSTQLVSPAAQLL